MLGPPRREEWFTNAKRKERTPTQEMGHALFMARVMIKRLKTLFAEHKAKCRCEVCKWNETNPVGPFKPLELLRAYVLTSQTILDDVATYGQPEDAESIEWEPL